MPRKLTPEECSLWDQVAASAKRLRPKEKQNMRPAPKQAQVRKAPKRPPLVDISAIEIGSKAVEKPIIPAKPQTITPRMDTKVFKRMKRGKLRPEATIDLHGMTVTQAKPALVSFVSRCADQNMRLVLVITGKGNSSADTDGPIPPRKGVLRQQVPNWLKSSGIGARVLDVFPAHISHGGTGAYYVYLGKNR